VQADQFFDNVYIEQVRCSGAFVPELSRVEELDDSYWFCYSVRMRLLNPAPGQTDALNTCQLSGRHWVTRANDTVVAEVRGRAVIGMVCPLFHTVHLQVATF
jgi:uncharacterized protein affecting Mg2+/Co2+ transport